MKILFLGINYWPEQIGIGLYSGDMCTTWAAMGHEVRAIVAAPYYPAWQVFDGYAGKGWSRSVERGVDVTRCPIYVPARPTGLKRIVHHLSFFCSSLFAMLGAAIRGRPDIVFTAAPSLIATPIAWLAARTGGAKCWLHVQDFEVEAALATGLVGQGPAARLGTWFERTVFALFDRVSSISPQMCRKLREKGVPSGKIYELRNWADIQAIVPRESSPYRDEFGVETPHVLLYAGALAAKQGLEVIPQAARLLSSRKDVTFVVCGEGPSRPALERAATELPNLRIYPLQPKERLNDLLALATIHLLPQRGDAADLVLPSKLANMLASGRPVIACAKPGTGLASEVEGAGLVCEPDDPEALSAAIETLLDDAELRAQLGEVARERAVERWSRQQILERFEGELHGLLAPR